jgi:hypothetical protein
MMKQINQRQVVSTSRACANPHGSLFIAPEESTALHAKQRLITPTNDDHYAPTLSESFNHEFDAWARHALASNGFG